MTTFITETLRDGIRYVGPRLLAESREDAQRQAADLGITLVGELLEEGEWTPEAGAVPKKLN